MEFDTVVSRTNLCLQVALPCMFVSISGMPDKKDYKALAAPLEQYIAEGARTITLVDLRKVEKLKMLAASGFWVPWAGRHIGALTRLSSGAIFVSDHPSTVSIVGKILKLMPGGVPMLMVGSIAEALDWMYANAGDLDLPQRAQLEAAIG